jgi:hypothetical protein
VFLVADIDHSNGMILGQRQVADKRGENTTLQPLQSSLDTTGMVQPELDVGRTLVEVSPLLHCRVIQHPTSGFSGEVRLSGRGVV